MRNRKDVLDSKCSAIEVEAREFKPILGGDYHITLRWESLDPDEKICVCVFGGGWVYEQEGGALSFSREHGGGAARGHWSAEGGGVWVSWGRSFFTLLV